MRLDIRLNGTTATDRACVMDCTVYARTEKDMQRQVKKAAAEGPWYYKGGSETVDESEQITVVSVQRLVDGKPE